MKALILFIGWCILLVLSWPLALLALFLLPLVWLLSLPFRLVAIVVQALFALIRALLSSLLACSGVERNASATPDDWRRMPAQTARVPLREHIQQRA